MKQPRHQDYDKALKRICSHPAMVEDLIRTFAPEIAAELDWSTLRKDTINWVGAGRDARALGGGRDVPQRYGDLAWRVWWPRPGQAGKPLHASPSDQPSGGWLVLMVEAQSAVDPSMTERVLTQCAMALSDYARQEVPIAGVLPVVLYTGEGPWTAPGAMETPAPKALAHPYGLLDARRRAVEHPVAKGLGATLFRIFAAPDAKVAVAEVMALSQRLGPAGAPMVEAFPGVLALVLWRLFPEGDADKAQGLLKTWLEGGEMEPLASRWIKEYGDECRAEGIRLGIEQGVEQGLDKGFEDQRVLLRGQASVKFGATTAHGLSPLLASVSEPERLARIAGWIIECATGEELLDRVRSLTNGARR